MQQKGCAADVRMYSYIFVLLMIEVCGDECGRSSSWAESCAGNLTAISDKPNQPRLKLYSKRSFGLNTVTHWSFKVVWYDKWRWIHYDQVLHKAFCYTCVLAMKQGKIKRFNANPSEVTFLSIGYCNWKDTSGDKHGGFKESHWQIV